MVKKADHEKNMFIELFKMRILFTKKMLKVNFQHLKNNHLTKKIEFIIHIIVSIIIISCFNIPFFSFSGEHSTSPRVEIKNFAELAERNWN